jgi:hypothetical protein
MNIVGFEDESSVAMRDAGVCANGNLLLAMAMLPERISVVEGHAFAISCGVPVDIRNLRACRDRRTCNRP